MTVEAEYAKVVAARADEERARNNIDRRAAALKGNPKAYRELLADWWPLSAQGGDIDDRPRR